MSKIVRGHGPMDAEVVFLAEAPSVEEVKAGIPFAPKGKAAQELNHYCLPPTRLTRDEIRIENMFEWMIPLDPRMKEQYLSKHFEKQKGDCLHRLSKCENALVIVALGVTALRCLGIDKPMELVNGIPHRLERDHILNQNRNQDVIVMPCYHPAAGLRQPERIRDIKWDFEQLGELLWGDVEIYPIKPRDTYYMEFKSEKVVTFVQNLAYAVDSEWTVDDETWCFTISGVPGVSYLVWPEDMHMWKGVLENSLVIYHNALADKPRLEACGIYPKQEIDTQIMAYHLELPQGLKTLSYRLCGIEQQSYRDVVRDVEDAIAIEYLETIADIEWPDPEPYLAWNPKPKQERVYDIQLVECTKRKKDAFQLDNDPNGQWYYEKKVFDHWKIVPGTEHGHDYMRQPQNIGKMAAGAIKRGSDPVKTLNKWRADERINQCNDAIGEWLGADLSMIDLDKAVQYACADADATLQVAVKLYKLYKQSGIPLPDELNVLEELCS
jgi:uracil-DNA glycosylase family 4